VSIPANPERFKLTGGMEISRVVTGLWQVADMEKDGRLLDPEKGADHLQAYVEDGFSTFDMADHYGSAEIIAGRLLHRYRDTDARPLCFTKWCPAPGPMTEAVVRAGIEERCQRLGVDRIDLLQFHWWSFEHPAWLDALHQMAELREQGVIGEIGVTNFDAAHMHLARADGIPVLTNQVSFSLLDRRAAGPLAELCAGSPMRLLAYGTLCGGFLSNKWLDKPEPASLSDWSSMKYKRFIEVIGGWEAYQGVLRAAAKIGDRHGVSIANVASRWVLEQPAVAGVIIGARLGEREHRADNLHLFSFALDAEDHAMLDDAFAATKPVPGDCGDEYRRPPFLTASGDLSHHLASFEGAYKAEEIPGKPGQRRVRSGSEWEDIAGYCRARRVGDRILVAGTTATAGADRVVAAGDAGAQTTYILDKIAGALGALGASMDDVIRTQVYLADAADVLAVSQAHGRVFGPIKPVNTTNAIGSLIGDYKVEIEAEALAA
jgi:aryl-alcohol dehydrogenase-like predicted oxidoreductase/enamine deaminase RidA (YjgF/YER057c/UK114 family)